MCQTSISGKMQEPDALAWEREPELVEQIFRLQCLVTCLLEKNEELRQQLSTRLKEERASLANPRWLASH